ncbi:MAG: ATP-binding protein [Chloroflexi bacterium]|nr:ATP-binding protein [Chloroflexota bacterium]
MPGKNTGTWSGADDTPGSPDCPVCHGAGMVHPLTPDGRPDYSRTVACRCVRPEAERSRRGWLQKYSNLGLLRHLTFENLAAGGRSGSPAQQRQFQRACEAAAAFAAEPSGWFILSGPSGCGKTHLAAAIANERLNRGAPALYKTAPDLLDHLRAAFSPSSEAGYDDVFEQLRGAPLLVLDDLGVQSSTPWAREKLDQLLTHRFNSELPTVIVTTRPVADLDERLRTRLTDARLCQVFEFEAAEALASYGWGPEFKAQKGMTFTSFDWRRVNLPAEQRENLEMVYRVALDFARSPEGWLVLQGANGCGKTHLSAAIANFRFEAAAPAVFVVVTEFLDHLRNAFNPESKVSYDQLFEKVKTAPLLVLDDFGEQSSTPWAQEKLYQVINYRYNARLPTVITTTCTLDEIDSRIASRLIDRQLSNFFNIIAPDYRGDLGPGLKARRRVRR